MPVARSSLIAMSDLTDAEEAMLPIPEDWMKTIEAVSGVSVYKNTKNYLSSVEHPYISQGINLAAQIPLPSGWILKETRSDGTDGLDSQIESFYYHPESGRSGW